MLVRHDDAPRLMFRSLNSFFTAATDFIASGEYLDTDQLPSDFAGAADHIAERLERMQGSTDRAPARPLKRPTTPLTASFGDFVQRCGAILTTTGMEATILEVYGKQTIPLNPGSVWLNRQSSTRPASVSTFTPGFWTLLEKRWRARSASRRPAQHIPTSSRWPVRHPQDA